MSQYDARPLKKSRFFQRSCVIVRHKNPSRFDAYTHSKRERSTSPNTQTSFRLSALNQPVTHRSSTKAGPAYPATETRKPHFDEGLLVSNVLNVDICEPSNNYFKGIVRAIDRPSHKQEPAPQSD